MLLRCPTLGKIFIFTVKYTHVMFLEIPHLLGYTLLSTSSGKFKGRAIFPSILLRIPVVIVVFPIWNNA